MPTAEINVPKKAKVRITPKLRKKFSCRQLPVGLITAHLLQLVARVEDDRREEEVKEQRVLERLGQVRDMFSDTRLGLTNMSRMRCPGAIRMIRPTTMPAKMEMTVSWMARMRLSWR